MKSKLLQNLAFNAEFVVFAVILYIALLLGSGILNTIRIPLNNDIPDDGLIR